MTSTSENSPSSTSVTLAQPDLKVPVVKDIHKEADDLIKQITQEFQDKLRLQSNLLAQDDELVLKNHVRDALLIIRRTRNRTWKEEFPIILGGVLLGSFAQGFPTEAFGPAPKMLLLTIYALSGIIGLALISYGFQKQNAR